MNEHANHERCCITELKRNEAFPIDDANYAEDADAADIADSVPGGALSPRPNCLWTSQGGRG